MENKSLSEEEIATLREIIKDHESQKAVNEWLAKGNRWATACIKFVLLLGAFYAATSTGLKHMVGLTK